MSPLDRFDRWVSEHNASVKIDRDETTGECRCRAWDYTVSVVAAGLGTGLTIDRAIEAFFVDAERTQVHPSFAPSPVTGGGE